MVLRAVGGRCPSKKTLPHERALCGCIAALWCAHNESQKIPAALRSTAALLPPSSEGATRGFQEVT